MKLISLKCFTTNNGVSCSKFCFCCTFMWRSIIHNTVRLLFAVSNCEDLIQDWNYILRKRQGRHLVSFVEAAALRSIVLRYAGAPIATTRTWCFFLSFCLFCDDVAFSEYFLYHHHCHFLFVWSVRRTFFPSRWCFSTL